MKKILFLFLLSTSLHAQLWSGLIAPNRGIDWTGAGAGSIPARLTQCGSTLHSTDSLATIQSTVSGCANTGQFVSLAAGTYNYTASLILSTSGVTLRGAGPQNTIINITTTSTTCSGNGATAVCITNGDGGSIGFSANVLTVTAGLTQGSTSITLGGIPGPICGSSGASTCPASSSITHLHIGSLMIINQQDDSSDTGNAYFCTDTSCSQQTSSGSVFFGRSQTQVLIVTSVNTGTGVVTFTPGLYAPNWTLAKNPVVGFSSTLPVTSFGLENMTINSTGATGGPLGATVETNWVSGSWFKNVKVINSTVAGSSLQSHFMLANSKNVSVIDNYMFGSSPTSGGYGMLSWQSGDNLFQNNICQKIASCMVKDAGPGDVIGYNFSVDNAYTGGSGSSPHWQQCDQFHHSGGDYYTLWEGNEGICFTWDSIHGTGNFLTAFRNGMSGFDPVTSPAGTNKTQNILTFNNMAYARYGNILYNVFGYGHSVANYQYIMSAFNDCGPGSPGLSNNYIYTFDDSGQTITAALTGAPPTGCNQSYAVTNDVTTNARPSASVARVANWDFKNGTVQNNSSEYASTASTYPGLAFPSLSYASYPTLYLPNTAGSPPSWWQFPSGSTAPFPAIGPEVTGGNISNTSGHAWMIPANNCYHNVMGGVDDGSSGVLNYDEANCYIGATPTCSVPTTLVTNPPGTYNSPPTVLPLNVGFNSSTPGCNMFYTSGSTTPPDPTCGSTPYPGGNFNLSSAGTTIIKVIACQAGYNSSTIASGTWNINIITSFSGATKLGVDPL